MTRKTAPEIIAFHIGWDMREVQDGRYQPSRFSSPGVYVCGEDYYCSPTGSQKPPSGIGNAWTMVGEAFGRKIYKHTNNA